jgi:hypothetical protein
VVSPVTAFDLRRRFGSKIAALVLAVSEDRGIGGYAERKVALSDQAVSAGDEALALFAADKISKARELRLKRPKLTLRVAGDRRRRLAYYRRSLRLLRERLPGSPLVEQLGYELAQVSRWPFASPPAASREAGGALASSVGRRRTITRRFVRPAGRS